LDLTVAIQNISQREKTSGNFFCHFISNKTKENTDHNKTSEVKISCVLFPDFREAPHCQHDEQEKSLEDPKEERHSGGNQRKHRDQVPTISLKLEHCNTLEHTGHHIFQG